jgi:thiazole/oxazole-forming peptide maturase SagD family component
MFIGRPSCLGLPACPSHCDELRRNAGELVGVLDLIDGRFGPILRMWGRRLLNLDWWVYSAVLARYPIGSPYVRRPLRAGGCAVERSTALQRMLGESVERYASMNPAVHVLPQRLRLADSPLYSRFPSSGPGDSGFAAPDSEAPSTHALVRNIASSESVPIPIGYLTPAWPPQAPEPVVTHPQAPEPVVTHWISTGSAFHSNYVRAVWAGALEVLERDALMRSWWTGGDGAIRITMPSGPPGLLAGRLARLTSIGLAVALYHLDTPCSLHTILAVLRSDRRPFTTVGCACKPILLDAMTKALDEAVSIRAVCEHIPYHGPGLRSVHSLEGHASLYADWEEPRPIESMALGAPERPMSDFAVTADVPVSESDLQHFALALRNCDLTLLCADITPTDVGHLGRVVRVIVPEAVPLAQSSSLRWLGTPRLRAALGEREPIPFPHPFA